MTTIPDISGRRRRDVVDALRRGTVPAVGLDVLATGLDRFAPTVDCDLDACRAGGSVFKAVRGEYGSGKTFFARWLCERARRAGFATSEVQISETETPLHRLETVYRQICRNLATAEFPPSALTAVLDLWLFTLEQDVATSTGEPAPEATSVDELLERRLAQVSRTAPAFARALRGYRIAQAEGNVEQAAGLASWLGGDPHVAAAIRRRGGVRGDLDHFGAMGFLQGLLTILRDCGHSGLVVVLDEVETLQRVRSDQRDKALNALRQLVDEVDAGRFPGLMLLITGTPAFYEGTQGINRLPPLAQRLATDFSTDPRFDNPRAAQIRLPGFTLASLCEVGGRVREIYLPLAGDPARISRVVDDSYLSDLAAGVAGNLGGKVGVAPRLYLKKLVAEVLDRVDQFPDFDPRRDYSLTVGRAELTDVERNAAASVDDIGLDLNLDLQR
jgi:hypothetical protein